MLAFIVIAANQFVFGQNKNNKIKVDTIQVSGNCNECKERIENAAYLPGVKRAEWNKDTKELTLIYNSKKVTSLEVEKRIAEAGHETEHVPANDSAYQKLPSCCAYHEVETH